MNDAPFFIHKLTSLIKERMEIPLFGKTPEFPLISFCEMIKSHFDLEKFEIEMLTSDWKEEKSIFEGFSSNSSRFSFVLSPLSPSFFWILEDCELWKILDCLGDKQGKRSFEHPLFQKGFTEFLLLNIAQAFNEKTPFADLKVKLSNALIPQEASYCIDLKIKFNQHEISSRVIFPSSFEKILSSHFSNRPFALHRVDSSLELECSIHVGKVLLNGNELKSINPGDFVILDECSYSPKNGSGSFTLNYNQTPLLILKRKNNELKVLAYSFYTFEKPEMEESSMSKQADNIFEDEENMFEEEESIDENEMFNDMDKEEEGEEQIEHTSSMEDLLSAAEIPLAISIEVAKIKMPLKEMLSLRPGNLLQLPISLEQGVRLTLNSQVIARGELMQIGDVLGVKISEIAH